jgi:glycosyltransferase involved in cell wall biosynthesis
LRKQNLLLFGPYPDARAPHHIGGTTILFKNFIDHLEANAIPHSYISITHFHGTGHRIFNFFYVFFKALVQIPKFKVVIFNFNRTGLLYIAPVLYAWAKIFRVHIVLRMFGDCTLDALSKSFFLHGLILKRILKNADLLFFETKKQVEYFKNYNANTHWFPNCREFPMVFHERQYHKRFVFISQLRVAKGVGLIVDAFKEIGNDYSIEIYGPVYDPELNYVKELPSYKGVLPFDRVYDVLNEHDVLLLPTFKGEGYPGIIIEAYAMSVPVIVSRWNSIPEMVNEGVSGLLIEPNSVTSLKEAILSIDKDNYKKLNKGAFEMSDYFRSDFIHQRILSIIQSKIGVI